MKDPTVKNLPTWRRNNKTDYSKMRSNLYPDRQDLLLNSRITTESYHMYQIFV